MHRLGKGRKFALDLAGEYQGDEVLRALGETRQHARPVKNQNPVAVCRQLLAATLAKQLRKKRQSFLNGVGSDNDGTIRSLREP